MTGKHGELGNGHWATTYGWWLGADTAWEAGIPWMRPPATDYMEAYLQPGMKVLEWGSGASTIWLARLEVDAVSLELDGEWYNQVQARMNREGIGRRVRLLYFPPQASRVQQLQTCADYILTQADGNFDLIMIDGRNRARCLANARRKVKPGGLLCLDNSDRVEYGAGVALYEGWPRLDWGDSGWLTTVWQRPEEWEPPLERVVLPNAEA